MSDLDEPTASEVDSYYQKVKKDAEASGYNLNPDVEFTKELLKSILINKKRYGYGACPCRLASGNRKEDLDLICPCDYRDPDLVDYGACYCGLYISGEILGGEKKLQSIPERRPSPLEREKMKEDMAVKISTELSKPIWRCKVCGYLCARDKPPEICPICKVSSDRFEKFM
jgi:ferredoxin-thioredoxin reductase catalytic subunit